jgi:SAM-dependent methyltransferase
VTAAAVGTARAPAAVGLVLRCPDDAGDVRAGTAGWQCSTCGRVFPEDRGVVALAGDDAFYEGAYLNTVNFIPRSDAWWHRWPLWLINSGYLATVRQFVPAGARIAEIGCAGGVRYFGHRYEMIGVDVSLTSLAVARQWYRACVRTDLKFGIPLPDQSVDAVVSSFVWEHLPGALKDSVLAECRRVLRPGGHVVFLFDVSSENPVITALQRADSSRYQREFLDHDGHIGYETARENDARFTHAGLQLVKAAALERGWLQSGSVFAKMREWPGMLGVIGKLVSPIANGTLWLGWNLLVRIASTTFDRALPTSWGRLRLITARVQ